MSPSTILSRHINRTVIYLPYSQQGRCRAMRQHRAGAASQNGSHPPSLLGEQCVPHRVNALVHAVQAARHGSLIRTIGGDTQCTQLLKRHQTALAQCNSRNPKINPPPTGLKTIYISALSPVGGGRSGGHWGSVAPADARVVR
jgi:hypothetical protein